MPDVALHAPPLPKTLGREEKLEFLPAIIGFIFAAIGVLVSLRLFLNVHSTKQENGPIRPLEELEAEYARWDRVVSFSYLLCAAGITYVLWKVLYQLSALHVSLIKPSMFLITQPSITWVLPAMFLSLFLSAIPLHFLYIAILGKERYAELSEYLLQKTGPSNLKLYTRVTYLFAPLCFIYIFLFLDSYVRVTEEQFIVNRVLGVGETAYGFNEINSITHRKSFRAPNGDIVRNEHFVIFFSDGTDYNFHESVNDWSFFQQKELIDYVSTRSEIQVQLDDPFPL